MEFRRLQGCIIRNVIADFTIGEIRNGKEKFENREGFEESNGAFRGASNDLCAVNRDGCGKGWNTERVRRGRRTASVQRQVERWINHTIVALPDGWIQKRQIVTNVADAFAV